jgi:hypothetical protein
MRNLSIRETALAGFLGFVALYALFQARYLILGPRISLTSPLNGSTATSSLVLVSGVAKNVTYISMNDRPIFLDEKGNFEEKFLAYPGSSTIIIKARDRFGRETEKVTKIILAE